MKMNLGDMVLAIISDNPGRDGRTIADSAASWGTVLSYLTTNRRAAWTLAKAHMDATRSIEDRVRYDVAELVRRGLVAESSAGTFSVTEAGSARLRERNL